MTLPALPASQPAPSSFAQARAAAKRENHAAFKAKLRAAKEAPIDQQAAFDLLSLTTEQIMAMDADELMRQSMNMAKVFGPMTRGRSENQTADAPRSLYAFLDPSSQMVKIGVAVDVGVRMRSVQAMSPVRLVLLSTKPGTLRAEGLIHKRLAAFRSHGEWFRYEGAVVDEIASWEAS